MNGDGFFIGYTGAVPDSHRGRVRAFVLAALLAGPLVAAAAALAQSRVDEGVYEYGVLRDFEGVIVEEPVPHLVTGPGEAALLVGFGKSGLPDFARGHRGKRVAFRGSLIERRGRRMIEVNDPGSFRVLGEAEAAAPIAAGRATIIGELLDTKCFFGAMRPAVGKVHRACAIRCLGAGIPAGVRVVDPQGRETVVLLAGRGGAALELDVQLSGLAVEATGEVELHHGLAVLRVERIDRAGWTTPGRDRAGASP